MSTVFHLIRHAAHGQLGQYLTGRTLGVSLSDRGRDQARDLGRRMADTPLDAICSSPQVRTRETAEFVAAGQGKAVAVAPDLDEIDFGRWAGQSFEALDADPAWKTWNEDRGRAQTPGGETMQAVATRIVRQVDGLRSAFPGGTIALVSHCDTIKAAVCHYLGLPFERMDRFDIAPASVTTLVVGDWGGKILALNAAGAAAEGQR